MLIHDKRQKSFGREVNLHDLLLDTENLLGELRFEAIEARQYIEGVLPLLRSLHDSLPEERRGDYGECIERVQYGCDRLRTATEKSAVKP